MEQHSHLQAHAEPDSRSWKEIVADIVRDIGEMFKSELRLAGIELKMKAQRAGKAGGLLAAAALLGFFSVGCFIATCVAALTILLPLWLSILLMGVLLAIAAGGAFLLGRMALQEIDPVPQQAIQELKDTVEWMKTHAKPGD